MRTHWNDLGLSENRSKSGEKRSIADILNFFNLKSADYYNILMIFLRKRG
jgi:hypothetical protein